MGYKDVRWVEQTQDCIQRWILLLVMLDLWVLPPVCFEIIHDSVLSRRPHSQLTIRAIRFITRVTICKHCSQNSVVKHTTN
jgi:hypothetical protein